MNASDDAPRERGSDEGWDENVVVWNATVARIPAPVARPDPDEDVAAVEAGSVKPQSGRRGGASS